MDRNEIHNSAMDWTRPCTPDRPDFQRADFTLGFNLHEINKIKIYLNFEIEREKR